SRAGCPARAPAIALRDDFFFVLVFRGVADLRGVPALRGVRALLVRLTAVFALVAPAFGPVAPAVTLSFVIRFDCHTRLPPLPSAISGIERPPTPETGIPSTTSGSLAPSVASSSAL